MNEQRYPINTIFSCLATAAVGLSWFCSGYRPEGIILRFYIAALAAAGISVLFSATRHPRLYAASIGISLAAAFLFMLKAPELNPDGFDNRLWNSYMCWIGICFLGTALQAFACSGRKVSAIFKIIPVVLPPILIWSTVELFHREGWSGWSDCTAYYVPCMAGVFIAYFLEAASIFWLAFHLGGSYVSSEYPAYVKRMMRGYSSSEFARQTGLKKKDVYDSPGASLQTRGNFGEYAAYRMLERAFPGQKKFLFGVVIPEMDGGFQEIDLLCFWRDKIIIGEAKNYSGHLTRDNFSPTWQLRQNNVVKEVGNPHLQNWQHHLALAWFLSTKNSLVDACDTRNMFLDLVFLNRKCSYDTANSRHDVRFGCIPNYIVTEEGLSDAANTFSSLTKGISSITPEVEKAYALLEPLSHHTKEEVAEMAQKRAYSSYYRTEAYRKERYYAYEKGRLLFRHNGLYAECLNVRTGNEIWSYNGTDAPLPDALTVETDDPEWYYGKILSEHSESAKSNIYFS